MRCLAAVVTQETNAITSHAGRVLMANSGHTKYAVPNKSSLPQRPHDLHNIFRKAAVLA